VKAIFCLCEWWFLPSPTPALRFVHQIRISTQFSSRAGVDACPNFYICLLYFCLILIGLVGIYDIMKLGCYSYHLEGFVDLMFSFCIFFCSLYVIKFSFSVCMCRNGGTISWRKALHTGWYCSRPSF
jgi:hypothetical protein